MLIIAINTKCRASHCRNSCKDLSPGMIDKMTINSNVAELPWTALLPSTSVKTTNGLASANDTSCSSEGNNYVHSGRTPDELTS